MRKLNRRLLQVYSLLLASMALARPVIGKVEACSNCTSSTQCEGKKPTGYVSCEIQGSSPCKVYEPTCSGGGS